MNLNRYFVILFLVFPIFGMETTEQLTTNQKALAIYIKVVKGKNLEDIKTLTKINPKVLTMQDKYGATPLMWAVQYGTPLIIKYLIKAGSDVNHKAKDNSTPLIGATIMGNLPAIKCLVENKAVINHKANCGTAWELAIKSWYWAVANYLEKNGATIDKSRKDVVKECYDETLADYKQRLSNEVYFFNELKNDGSYVEAEDARFIKINDPKNNQKILLLKPDLYVMQETDFKPQWLSSRGDLAKNVTQWFNSSHTAVKNPCYDHLRISQSDSQIIENHNFALAVDLFINLGKRYSRLKNGDAKFLGNLLLEDLKPPYNDGELMCKFEGLLIKNNAKYKVTFEYTWGEQEQVLVPDSILPSGEYGYPVFDYTKPEEMVYHRLMRRGNPISMLQTSLSILINTALASTSGLVSPASTSTSHVKNSKQPKVSK